MQHIEEMPEHVKRSISRNRIFYILSMVIIAITIGILILINADLIFKYKGKDKDCNCLSANVISALYYDNQ